MQQRVEGAKPRESDSHDPELTGDSVSYGGFHVLLCPDSGGTAFFRNVGTQHEGNLQEYCSCFHSDCLGPLRDTTGQTMSDHCDLPAQASVSLVPSIRQRREVRRTSCTPLIAATSCVDCQHCHGAPASCLAGRSVSLRDLLSNELSRRSSEVRVSSLVRDTGYPN